MKIAILGTGGVGGTLAARWAQLGHNILLGSRDPHSDKVRQLLGKLGSRGEALSWSAAAAKADVLLLAVPYRNATEVVAACGDLSGKVLVDCTNPLTPDIKSLVVGHTTSAAEQIAAAAPKARVVKAFNTVGVKAMANPKSLGEAATLFYCGDDPAAKQPVHQLASELGFEAIDAGPLRIARYLEPLAMLYIHLAVHEGMGGKIAFKLLRPKSD